MTAAPATDQADSAVGWIDLRVLLASYVPGSHEQPWTWDDERRDLLAAVCQCCGQPGHYQLALEEHYAKLGRIDGSGIVLGTDGRIWDGHHRIVAAIRLGFPGLPVERFDDSTARSVGAFERLQASVEAAITVLHTLSAAAGGDPCPRIAHDLIEHLAAARVEHDRTHRQLAHVERRAHGMARVAREAQAALVEARAAAQRLAGPAGPDAPTDTPSTLESRSELPTAVGTAPCGDCSHVAVMHEDGSGPCAAPVLVPQTGDGQSFPVEEWTRCGCGKFREPT